MELTRMQKIMLLVLAGMLMVFGVLMAVFRAHPGVMFEESLLKISEHEGRTVYSGTAHGTPVDISVEWPTNFRAVVDFTIGTEIHDVYELEYPLELIQTYLGTQVNGIRVTKNGALIFEGGYNRAGDDFTRWFDADGSFHPWLSIRIRAYGTGNPWYGYETDAADAARFAFGPVTSARGDPFFFSVAVLCSVILAVQILFHKQLFRFEHRWARDPEPSDAYLAFEQVLWILVAVIIAGLYITALVKIY